MILPEQRCTSSPHAPSLPPAARLKPRAAPLCSRTDPMETPQKVPRHRSDNQARHRCLRPVSGRSPPDTCLSQRIVPYSVHTLLYWSLCARQAPSSRYRCRRKQPLPHTQAAWRPWPKSHPRVPSRPSGRCNSSRPSPSVQLPARVSRWQSSDYRTNYKRYRRRYRSSCPSRDGGQYPESDATRDWSPAPG